MSRNNNKQIKSLILISLLFSLAACAETQDKVYRKIFGLKSEQELQKEREIKKDKSNDKYCKVLMNYYNVNTYADLRKKLEAANISEDFSIIHGHRDAYFVGTEVENFILKKEVEEKTALAEQKIRQSILNKYKIDTANDALEKEIQKEVHLAKEQIKKELNQEFIDNYKKRSTTYIHGTSVQNYLLNKAFWEYSYAALQPDK